MTAHARMAIVGTGRVAQALGRLLAQAGLPPVAVAGRTASHAERAASFIGPAVKTARIRDIPGLADRILIAVADAAIPSVVDDLSDGGLGDGIALHTSGAHGPGLLDALTVRGVSCGVLHPLQTIADPERGVAALHGASFGIGGAAPAIEWAEEIVAAAQGTPLRIHNTGFASYHAGAVMAGNAVVAAIDAAVVLFGAAGVDRNAALQAIRPLCLTSAQNALELGPEAALTGPVQRGDADTIRAHTVALANSPRYVSDLYRASGQALLEIAKRRGLAEASAKAVELALDGR
ncbi:MAG TPA: DUF2520 domain-containing protein [Vicinamibacterales bacterium]|jgi:predicted short-subunit dehydrogenase-like oxidoreductase (DUF2520 family)|nr:DUF2520 domain-containing protein [Vicinamibacterales bacterium]